MGAGNFLYLNGNYVYGIADHANGVKSSVPWGMAGIGSDFLALGQTLATDGASALARSAAASGATSSAEALTSFAKGAATPIINAGLITLTVESNMLGFGRPEDGARFTEGADHFRDAHSTLLKSAPPGDWTGESSVAYGDRNKEQQARAADMSATDAAVQKVLAEEAGQVDKTREFVSKCQTLLSLSIVPAIAAKAIPAVGEAISIAIEVAAVAATVPAGTVQVHQMASRSGQHASRIKDLASQYDTVGSNAEMPGGGFGSPSSQSQLTVSDQIRSTSTVHDDAAAKIKAAGSATDGSAGHVFQTHGLVCSPTAMTLKSAEMSRREAAQKMHEISTDLAVKLRSAATEYEATDHQQGGALDGQMQPR